MSQSLVIFRQDLRLVDNTALLEAARDAESVALCFIVDEAIVSRYAQHTYRLAFLKRCLEDLQAQAAQAGARLNLFMGRPEVVVPELMAREGFSAVYVNRTYTPAARRRDAVLAARVKAAGGQFFIASDALLNEPDQVTKQTGGHYSVFTPFFNRARQLYVAPPRTGVPDNLSAKSLSDLALPDLFTQASEPSQQAFLPGRAGALAVLDNVAPLADYDTRRDFPGEPGTARLSAHLKFGTCSVREVYDRVKTQLGGKHALLRQLYWRDFYVHIAWHRPDVFGHAFRAEYDALAWDQADEAFARWCAGETGFPIVDAGMRELVNTGFMHNRVRMIVASFLVKNLHIDWRRGEAFFARYLIDYEPCANNGNWQWNASTGSDAQPYFRIFNPWRQQLRFDPDCIYIKQWVPALAHWPAKSIHRLEKDATGYLPQIVDLKASAENAKARFRAVRGDA